MIFPIIIRQMLLMTAAAKHFSTFPPSSSLASSSAFHGFGVANSLISEDFDDLIEEEEGGKVSLFAFACNFACSFNIIYLYDKKMVDGE